MARYWHAADERSGYVRFCTAGEDLRLLTFGTCRLGDGERWTQARGPEETLAVILWGRVDARAGSRSWEGLGGRASVFAGPATAVYVPPSTEFQLQAQGGPALVALCQTPLPAGSVAPESYVIGPEEVRVQRRGAPGFARDVHDILDAQRPAVRLLVGETFNEIGNWSSYPPHKHDVERGAEETALEELYYFQVSPEQGFGAQFLYTGDGALNEAYRVGHGDVTLLPRGYHPVAAAPGYRLYYLWVLAGERRLLRPVDDPAHAWVKTAAAR